MEHAKGELVGNILKKLLRDSLINVRQHEICLKTLLHDIINCAKNVEGLETQLAQHLEQLKSTVQSKTAIPTAQVYVSFILFVFFATHFSITKIKLFNLLSYMYIAPVHTSC